MNRATRSHWPHVPMSDPSAARLSRRTLFRGLGGAALASALPVAFASPAQAGEPAATPP